jgi:group I intron endonuclease
MVVYKITNKINKKIYIGCTINFDYRIKRHFSGKYCGSNLLYRAINKYGKECFEVEIIKKYYNLKSMKLGEIKYINLNNSIVPNGYNVHFGGSGGKIKLTKEQLNYRKEFGKRMSKYHIGNKYALGRVVSDETRLKISKSNKGKKISKETRLKMSLSKKGVSVNKGVKLSEKHKESLSKSLKGRIFSTETKIKMSISAKKRMVNVKRDSNGRIMKK